MYKNLLVVGIISLFSLLLFWSPFLLRLGSIGGIEFGRHGMETIVQNFDGLNFLIISKSGYDPETITWINQHFLTGNPPMYFAAHFPLFPLLIHSLDSLVSLPTALLLSIIISNLLLAVALYLFFEQILRKDKLAVILTTICLFWPARMLAVRAVGSNEPLFMALIVSSLVASIRGRDWMAGTYGALAVLTRSPGILLFGAYLLAFYKQPRRLVPYLLLPLSLMLLFGFYYLKLGSVLAYFESGDNLHLSFMPFQIFATGASWVSGIWREDILYLYLFYGLGLILANKLPATVKYFGWIYALVLLFVAHRDLARYALPLAPVALLGYARYAAKLKPYLWLLALILIPIYLFGWQFVMGNIQPINDWGALL